MHRLLRTGDFWAGLAFAALGAYIVSEARGWVYLAEDGPGAGFFPLWYGIAMLALSLALVAGAAMKTWGRSKTNNWGQTPINGIQEAELSKLGSDPNYSGVGRALACWAALAVSVALLKLAGFIVSFALLSWFIVAILCRKRARLAIALSIGWAVLFWVVFSWGLDMSLPPGRFF